MTDINSLAGLARRCIDDYGMVSDGDRIAVGVSGGKDSLALLYVLAELRRYYPKKFTLTALTLSMGFEEMDFTPVRRLCDELEIPYIIKETQLRQLIFEDRKEKNPCALCSKMRRGALIDMMKENGLNKIALGHHYDDAVETFLLSLFYEGRISCFQPVTYMSRTDVTQIRPLLYVPEAAVRGFAERYALPVVENPCPMDEKSKRQDVKILVDRLSNEYPDLKSKVFGAMQRLPLEGWARQEHKREKSTN